MERDSLGDGGRGRERASEGVVDVGEGGRGRKQASEGVVKDAGEEGRGRKRASEGVEDEAGEGRIRELGRRFAGIRFVSRRSEVEVESDVVDE